MPQYALFNTLVIALGSALLSISHSVYAQTTTADMAQQLGQHQAWLNLLHYKPGYLHRVPQSQVDDAQFFLSAQGKQDPTAELQALLKALPGSLSLPEKEAVQCRFPARFHWLSQQQPTLKQYTRPCAELDHWRSSLDAAGATLIFPASYLNSPSSMYGHTLLRLDQHNQSDSNKLLAFSVNFAAVADETDNELVFSWKGLTGGYPGHISVMPYYEKVNEYNGMENRDIWEFELNLSVDETSQLVSHLWEIMSVRFDYFFFDENCSYRVLTLLDIARPGTNSAHQFRWHAIPTDTIRSLASSQLLANAHFRPSQASTLKSQLSQLSTEELALANRLAKADALTSLEHLDTQKQQATLETAYQYSRYLARDEDTHLKALNQRSLKLLSQRSKLPSGSPLNDPTPPSIRDDQGHNTARLNTRLGYDDQAYLELSARIAYHDLLDPSAGYIRGAQIEMGEISLRAYDDRVRVQAIELLNIRSLTPRDEFFSTTSWHVSAGAERQRRAEAKNQSDNNRRDRDPLLGMYLNAGAGLTYAINNAASSLTAPIYAYAFIDGALRQGPDLQNNFAMGSGPSMGLQGYWGGGDGMSGQWQVGAHHYRFISGSGDDLHHRESAAHITWALDIKPNVQLRLKSQYLKARASKYTDWQLGVNWYY